MTPGPLDSDTGIRPDARSATGPAAADRRRPVRSSVVAAVVIALALLLAGIGSRLASSSPDGLERVAEDHGLAGHAADHALADSPVAGYSLRGVDDDGFATGAAGVLGVVATLAVGSGVAVLLRRSARHRAPAPSPSER